MKKDNNVCLKNKLHYQNLRDKYVTAAKDAASSGDRVLSEYNLQCAEHYKRMLSEKYGFDSVVSDQLITDTTKEPAQEKKEPKKDQPKKKIFVRKQKTDIVN